MLPSRYKYCNPDILQVKIEMAMFNVMRECIVYSFGRLPAFFLAGVLFRTDCLAALVLELGFDTGLPVGLDVAAFSRAISIAT